MDRIFLRKNCRGITGKRDWVNDESPGLGGELFIIGESSPFGSSAVEYSNSVFLIIHL
jgi:hypothetical protein